MSNLFHIPLTEKYRPSTWDDVVGQDKIVSRIRQLASRKALAGRAYWLSGQSGTGKTTIARLIAQEVADEFMIEEVDATSLTVPALVELKRPAPCPAGARKPAGPSSSTKPTGCARTLSVNSLSCSSAS